MLFVDMTSKERRMHSVQMYANSVETRTRLEKTAKRTFFTVPRVCLVLYLRTSIIFCQFSISTVPRTVLVLYSRTSSHGVAREAESNPTWFADTDFSFFVWFTNGHMLTSPSPLFFLSTQGNAATGGCCSKCWRDSQKKKDNAVAPIPEPKKNEPLSAADEPMVQAKPVVEEPKKDGEVEAQVEKQPAATPTKKKGKKKKKSYKAMMAGMMTNSPDRDVEKEKDALRKVTGGGAFSKIEKI